MEVRISISIAMIRHQHSPSFRVVKDSFLEVIQLNFGAVIVCATSSLLLLDEMKRDRKAFVFTLKYQRSYFLQLEMAKIEVDSITCSQDSGPIFDSNLLHIWDTTDKNGHKELNISGACTSTLSQTEQYFRGLDYEVYTIDYESKYTIDHICKHPDIVWEYVQTKDISEESLRQLDDGTELMKDLSAIQCADSAIQLKISRHYLKNPSEYLPLTQLVNQQYDKELREWLGNEAKWKLIYRASEHDYTAKSFHECCDNKGSTLVVIKSTEGWIFGGFTTESWTDNGKICMLMFIGYSLIDECKEDENGFLFVLTPAIKKFSKCKIQCSSGQGPIFLCKDSRLYTYDACQKSQNYLIVNDEQTFASLNGDLYTTSKIQSRYEQFFFKVVDYEVYNCDI